MKNLISKILTAITILIGIFMLGITPAILVTSFIAIFTNATYEDCITTAPFWIITFLGWLCAAIYVNKELKK